MEERIVKVRWEDHDGSSGDAWWGVGEIRDLPSCVIETVGTVLSDDEHAIVVAGQERGGKYGDWHRILRALVLEITEYRAEAKGQITKESARMTLKDDVLAIKESFMVSLEQQSDNKG